MYRFSIFLQTWFQNRRAKEKRARLISTSTNRSEAETSVKEDSCDGHLDGKPVLLVSPHIVKTPSTTEMIPTDGVATSHSPGFVARHPFQSNPYYSSALFSCPQPTCPPDRLTDVRTLTPPPFHPIPRNPESATPRNVRKIAPVPSSSFSRVVSPGLSPGTGISCTSIRPVSDCPPRLPYPVPSYVQRITLPSWTHEPQVLTPPSSPSLWQGGSGMSYPTLRPYAPMPIGNPMKDTDQPRRPTYNFVPNPDHIPPNSTPGHTYQFPYPSTGKSDFSSTQKPGLSAYYGNHSMGWHPQETLQCKQNVFPYGCDYVGNPPVKVLPTSLYPWSYPGHVSPSYTSDISLLTGYGNSSQFDEKKQVPGTVFNRSPGKDNPE